MPAKRRRDIIIGGEAGGVRDTERRYYDWMDARWTPYVVECCDDNDLDGLSAFFRRPDAHNVLTSEMGGFPFRLLARRFLRSISSRHFQVADLLARQLTPHLPVNHHIDPLAVDDFLRRLTRVLLVMLTDPNLHNHIPSWLDAFRRINNTDKTSWSIERWKEFEELYRNDGGESSVWTRFRASSRAVVASRLFARDKTQIQETYLPYFSERAFGKRCLQILASQCRMFVSKSQLCKSMFANNDFLQTNILTTVLETWRQVTKSNLRDLLRMNSDDLQKLLYINNPDLRRERFDAVTSSGPQITIPAQDLQRFHLTAFPDEQNPVPWIHATIVISRSQNPMSWLSNQIIAFYLSKQIAIRKQAKDTSLSIIDHTTRCSLPPELIHIVIHYIFTPIEQLVSIDSNSVSPDEQLAFKRLWTIPKPKLSSPIPNQ